MSGLTITDTPAGARVWIDGELAREATDAAGEHDQRSTVASGEHDVVAELSTGERRWLLRVWVADDEELAVPFATLEGAETRTPVTPSATSARSPWRALLLAGAAVGTAAALAWLASSASAPTPARSAA